MALLYEASMLKSMLGRTVLKGSDDDPTETSRR
jgi:hypothetical protein